MHSGPNGLAGEWGHNPLPWQRPDEFPGDLCYCGQRGCIERWLCGPALEEDYRRSSGSALVGIAQSLLRRGRRSAGRGRDGALRGSVCTRTRSGGEPARSGHDCAGRRSSRALSGCIAMCRRRSPTGPLANPRLRRWYPRSMAIPAGCAGRRDCGRDGENRNRRKGRVSGTGNQLWITLVQRVSRIGSVALQRIESKIGLAAYRPGRRAGARHRDDAGRNVAPPR